MKQNTLTNVWRGTQQYVAKHAPEALLILGIAAGVATVASAVKATPKALRLMDEKKKEEHKDELTPLEIVQTCWKPYIPTAVTGTTSVLLLMSANSIHVKRNTALAAACKLSEVAFMEYRDKVVETIGEKTEKEVRHRLAQDKIDQHPVSKSEVYFTGNGKTLFLDLMTKRYFWSDRDTIQRAANEINRRITLGDMYASLNDFYTEIGLDHADVGDMVGFTVEHLIELDWSAHMADDGTPCIGIGFLRPPVHDYDKFM